MVSGNNLPAGTYSIVPSLTFKTPIRYSVNAVPGTLVITRAVLVVSAGNKTGVYGASLPAFTSSVTGYKYSDDSAKVLNGPTTYSLLNSAGQAVALNSVIPTGTYTIIPTLSLKVPSNYTVNKVNGILVINRATLVVKARDTGIFKGDNPPVLTSSFDSYTGFVNGDQGRIVSISNAVIGYNRQTSPAGTYPIRPSALVLQNRADTNYIITYLDGILYVNPKGPGTRKVKPALECIEVVSNHPSGLGFVAHFSYENLNSTPIFVPRGPDNQLVIDPGGVYSGLQPVVFYPGKDTFDIYFNGIKLKWILATYENNQKSSSASEASSTSSKCPNSFVSNNLGQSSLQATGEEVVLPARFGIYPNPIRGRVTISYPGMKFSNNSVLGVYDVLGRKQAVQLSQASVNNIVLDLSNLKKGVYIVWIRKSNGAIPVRIVKE